MIVRNVCMLIIASNLFVRRGRRRKQLVDDLKETRGCWKLKEEALDRTVWRNGFRKRLGTCRKADCRRNEREEGWMNCLWKLDILICFYFVQWPTNTQLFHKLSHSSYMFRHYCVILRELVDSTLSSYTSMSVQLLVIQFKTFCICFMLLNLNV